jgi:hypothetical protein
LGWRELSEFHRATSKARSAIRESQRGKNKRAETNAAYLSIQLGLDVGDEFRSAACRVRVADSVEAASVSSDISKFSFPFNAGTEGETVRIDVESA